MSRLNYAAIRQRISMAQVLTLIEFTPTEQRGDQWRGPCPCCREPTDRRVLYFSVNIQRNLFRCFRCQRSGNQLDLWSASTDLPLYDATLELCRQLELDPFAITNPQPRNST
jgi:hypothetical protein